MTAVIEEGGTRAYAALMKTTTLKISGMSCGSCVAHVEKAFKAVPGVTSVTVDLNAKRATVQHNGVEDAVLIGAVTEEGYEAEREG